jgi:hypothetical protein
MSRFYTSFSEGERLREPDLTTFPPVPAQAQWASAVGSIFSVLHTALESANQTLLPGTSLARARSFTTTFL